MERAKKKREKKIRKKKICKLSHQVWWRGYYCSIHRSKRALKLYKSDRPRDRDLSASWVWDCPSTGWWLAVVGPPVTGPRLVAFVTLPLDHLAAPLSSLIAGSCRASVTSLHWSWCKTHMTRSVRCATWEARASIHFHRLSHMSTMAGIYIQFDIGVL